MRLVSLSPRGPSIQLGSWYLAASLVHSLGWPSILIWSFATRCSVQERGTIGAWSMTMSFIAGLPTLKMSSFGTATFSVAGMALDLSSVKVSVSVSFGPSSFVRRVEGETSQPAGRLARSSYVWFVADWLTTSTLKVRSNCSTLLLAYAWTMTSMSIGMRFSTPWCLPTTANWFASRGAPSGPTTS